MPALCVLPPFERPDAGADDDYDDVPVRFDEVGDVDQRLGQRGKGLAEAGEHLREDRDDELDEASCEEKGDRDYDGRIGHRALDLPLEAGRGLHDRAETLEDAGEFAGLFACQDHVDVHVVEESREVREALRQRIAALYRLLQVGQDLLELRIRALLLERLYRREDGHSSADHRGELPRERDNLGFCDFPLSFDLWRCCHLRILRLAFFLPLTPGPDPLVPTLRPSPRMRPEATSGPGGP